MICRFLVGIIKGYRWFISPYLMPRCRFEPTCSRYAIHSLQHHGVGKGLVLIFRRIIRCHPYAQLGGDWGYDPVPSIKKADKSSVKS